MTVPGFLVRFRPAGPWRFGPESGARDRTETMCHSDSLYSALTAAMDQLGRLEDWLEDTARAAAPAVQMSSCFPYAGQTLFVMPPRSLWPPSPSAKVRWKGARFVPLAAVQSLANEKPLDEDRWAVDPASECLLALDKNQSGVGPFRIAVRNSAAVDRVTHASAEVHSTACVEFTDGAGLWCAIGFADEAARGRWSDIVKGAFRLLADTGIGGERSRGWGRSHAPEFVDGNMPDLILPARSAGAEGAESAYWLLSLFSPGADDTVDWQRGNYSLITRGGRIESRAGWGNPKQLSRMVEEGSVVFAAAPPKGRAHDVAPAGFPHPVFRAGFALAVSIAWRAQS